MVTKRLPINQIKPNPHNPRIIKDSNYKKLLKSIQSFPEMADAREIIVNQDYMILGGNMRFKAMQEAGWKEVPVKIVDWSEEKQREFTIKDNLAMGEWDWELLANEWEQELLNDWGVHTTTETEFVPNLMPQFSDHNVTNQEIEKKARELATQMLKETKYKDVICPECGHEFSLEND